MINRTRAAKLSVRKFCGAKRGGSVRVGMERVEVVERRGGLIRKKRRIIHKVNWRAIGGVEKR